MSDLKIKVKVFSDRKDVSSVTSVIKQIEIKEAEIICQTPREIRIEKDEIIVILIENLYSKLLDSLLDQKKIMNNKFIIVTRKDSALLVSSLIKMGFADIFLFPHEIPGFISLLTEIINNKTYLSIKESNAELDLYDFKSLLGVSHNFLSIIEIAK